MRANGLKLGGELLDGRRAWRERLPRHASQLLRLCCGVGEGEQELSGGTDRQRQGLSDLGEVAKLVVAFHGRHAHPSVPLPNVEVHALADGVAQSHHGRFRDADDVRDATGRLAPARQTGSGHVVRRPDAEEESELH